MKNSKVSSTLLIFKDIKMLSLFIQFTLCAGGDMKMSET